MGASQQIGKGANRQIRNRRCRAVGLEAQEVGRSVFLRDAFLVPLTTVPLTTVPLITASLR